MIEHYSFGRVTCGGKDYASDILVYRGEVSSWWREKGHSVCERDIEALLGQKPAILIIGTGAYGIMRVPKDFRRSIEARNIRLIAERTGEAVRIFNESLSRGEDVAIGMHLTC